MRRQLPRAVSDSARARSPTHQRRRHERVSRSKHLDAVACRRRCKHTGARVQERRDVLRGAAWSAQTGAWVEHASAHLLRGIELCHLLGLHLRHRVRQQAARSVSETVLREG